MKKSFWLGNWGKLWNDETGAIISAELVIVMSVLVIGLVAGLSEVRTALTMELTDISGAISGMNQTYRIPPIIGRGSFVAGSQFVDSTTQRLQTQQQQQFQPGLITPDMLFDGSKGDKATMFEQAPMIENNVYVNNTTN